MATSAKILMIINLLVMLGSAGLVYYSNYMIKKVPTDQAAELQNMLNDSTLANKITPHKLKKITVNLYSQKNRLRYLDVELDLLPFKEEDKEILKKHNDIIFDIIIQIASDMTPEELNSVSGRILLENRIKTQINQALSKSIIREIFFSRFVIQ